MSEVEDMKKQLDENPEQKEILNRQLKYYFPKWIAEKNKAEILRHIPDSDKQFLFQCILLGNISAAEIEQSRRLEEYQTIENLFMRIMDGQAEFLDEVSKIYAANVKRIQEEYSNKIKELKYNHLPKDKRKQIEQLRSKQENDKVNIILSSYKKYNEKIKKIENGFKIFINLSKIFDVYQFTPKALQCNKDILPKVSFAVFSPLFLMPPYMHALMDNRDEFPSSWYLYNKLTIKEYRSLLENKNSEQAWNDLFHMAIHHILEKSNIPILPIIKRKDLINSVVFHLQNKHYDSALIIIFSLIEGFLWELAFLINRKEKVFHAVHEMYDYNKKEMFQSTRIRDVVERTAVKKYLDEAFIKEFCEELYEERNPVLHGKQICHYECKQQGLCLIKKVFVLDYVIDTLEQVYQKNLFSDWDHAFDENKKREFLTDFYRS